MILAVFFLSLSGPKLQKFEKVGVINTIETASTSNFQMVLVHELNGTHRNPRKLGKLDLIERISEMLENLFKGACQICYIIMV